MQKDAEIPQAFRDHFTRHNRQAIMLGIITLIAAILLWTVFYAVFYTGALLAFSIFRGADDVNISHAFFIVFIVCALLLCALAWLVRKIRPNYFPVDNKPPLEVFLDILLVLPRVTFEVWGNFSALQFPTERELRASWKLLHAMGSLDAHGKMSIQRLPLEIPKPDLRERVVFLLQLAGLVGVRRYDDELWLVLQDDKARYLAQSTHKIDTEPAEPAQEPKE